MRFENPDITGGGENKELSAEQQELLKKMGEYTPSDNGPADLKYRAPEKPDKDVPGQGFTNLGSPL